jgi:hypothetical protein
VKIGNRPPYGTRCLWILGALIIALVCGATARRSEITISTIQEKLSPKAFRMFVVRRVPIFKTSKEENLQRPVHCGVCLSFRDLHLDGVLRGKGASDAVNDYYPAAIKNGAIGHYFWQCVANLHSEPNIFYCKGASTSISEVPSQIDRDDSIVVRRIVKPADLKVHEINVRPLRSSCDLGQSLLGVSSFDISVRTSFDSCGLLRNSLCLELCFRSLLFQSSYLFANSTELIGHGIGLPFGLNGQIRQITDGAFDVASVACDTVGSQSDNEHGDADKAVNKVKNTDFMPKRLIGRLVVPVGAVLASMSLLWLLVAARLNFTLADAGWRGVVAFCLFGLGAILIWQGVSLAVGV